MGAICHCICPDCLFMISDQDESSSELKLPLTEVLVFLILMLGHKDRI